MKGSVGQMVNQQDTVDTGDGSDSHRLCRSRTHWGRHPIEIRTCHIAIPFFFTHSVRIAHNKAQGARPIRRKVGNTLGTSLPLKTSFHDLSQIATVSLFFTTFLLRSFLLTARDHSTEDPSKLIGQLCSRWQVLFTTDCDQRQRGRSNDGLLAVIPVKLCVDNVQQLLQERILQITQTPGKLKAQPYTPPSPVVLLVVALLPTLAPRL